MSYDILEYAKQVLPPEVLADVLSRKSRTNEGINYHGMKILNRWALNSPEKLLKMTAKEGYPQLELWNRLFQQQQLEFDILMSDQGLEMLKYLAVHEILEIYGVNTEL